MEDTKQFSNGYERYNEIVRKLCSKCNSSNFVSLTLDAQGIFAEKMKHYKLEEDIHVYIGEDETIAITKGECGSFDASLIDRKNSNNLHFSLVQNKRLKDCTLNIYGEDVIEGIVIQLANDFGYNYEVEEETRDMWFLPSNIEPWEGEKPREINQFHGELPPDYRILLEEAIAKSENQQTKDVYMEALEFYDKIMHIATKDDKKITPTEAMRNALKTTSTDKADEAATLEKEDVSLEDIKI